MVRKKDFENDPVRLLLKSLAVELDVAVENSASDDPADADRRARALSTLAKAIQTLGDLLREQRERAAADRSVEDRAAQRRDFEVWREIESRLARLRAAQDAAAHRQASGALETGDAPP